MATVEHCLACFEALAAHLEGREAMPLSEIQKSWPAYVEVASKLPKKTPALRRIAGLSGTNSGSSTPSTRSGSASWSGSGCSTPSVARDVAGVAMPATSVSSTPASPIFASPLFVTWTMRSARHEDGYVLRGCIGTFEAQPLAKGLVDYALTSALQDTRFSPVARSELPALAVAVTLLTNFENAADPMDWDLGTHGIRITFTDNGRRYSSTYLPDVALEQGWTKKETVISLMRKANWFGREDRWADVHLRLVRYQGKKESLEYTDYERWRSWVDG